MKTMTPAVKPAKQTKTRPEPSANPAINKLREMHEDLTKLRSKPPRKGMLHSKTLTAIGINHQPTFKDIPKLKHYIKTHVVPNPTISYLIETLEKTKPASLGPIKPSQVKRRGRKPNKQQNSSLTNENSTVHRIDIPKDKANDIALRFEIRFI